jgi:hypothetical protein
MLYTASISSLGKLLVFKILGLTYWVSWTMDTQIKNPSKSSNGGILVPMGRFWLNAFFQELVFQKHIWHHGNNRECPSINISALLYVGFVAFFLRPLVIYGVCEILCAIS